MSLAFSTTNDDFFMDLVGASPTGRQAPPLRPHAVPPEIMTAAVISASKLLIVTLRQGRDLRVDPRRSAMAELTGRDSSALKALRSAVEHFARANGIRQIMLRANPGAGPYAAKPEAYKIEAVLQLLPETEVTLLKTQSVAAWIRREAPRLPEPWLSGRAQEKVLQARAIEAAAYAICNVGDLRLAMDPDL